jgi:hypothetical protein
MFDHKVSAWAFLPADLQRPGQSKLTSGRDFGMMRAALQLKINVPVKEQHVSRVRTSPMKDAFGSIREIFLRPQGRRNLLEHSELSRRSGDCFDCHRPRLVCRA